MYLLCTFKALAKNGSRLYNTLYLIVSQEDWLVEHFEVRWSDSLENKFSLQLHYTVSTEFQMYSGKHGISSHNSVHWIAFCKSNLEIQLLQQCSTRWNHIYHAALASCWIVQEVPFTLPLTIATTFHNNSCQKYIFNVITARILHSICIRIFRNRRRSAVDHTKVCTRLAINNLAIIYNV